MLPVGRDLHAMCHVLTDTTARVAVKRADAKTVLNAGRMTVIAYASLDLWEQIVKMYVPKDTTVSIVSANVHANRINSFVMPRTVAYVGKDSLATTAANSSMTLKNK